MRLYPLRLKINLQSKKKPPRLPIGSGPTPLDQVHFPPGTDRYSSNRNTAASRTGGGGNENQVGLLIYTIL